MSNLLINTINYVRIKKIFEEISLKPYDFYKNLNIQNYMSP